MKIIALEEHFIIDEVVEAWRALDPQWQDIALRPASVGDSARQLSDLGSERIASMDAAGIDVQILSFLPPGVQNLAAPDAERLQVEINDRMAAVVRQRPDRFEGFATLATPAPQAAARELERAVTTLGMNGAMLYGRTRERNADHKDFWPIYEVADALRAPLYLHPQAPPPAVRDAYYNGYGPMLDAGFASFGIGWHYDAGVQLVRLILGGVFDRFPNLQIISGHWGEVVLFYMERLEKLVEAAGLPRTMGEYFRAHVHVTPGGIFSERYLRWSLELLGIERILFAIDYPFELPTGGAARKFIEDALLGEAERSLFAHGNWDRLRSAIRR